MNNKESNNHNSWHTIWYNNQDKNAFILHKTDKTQVIIKKGDWIKIPGRNDMVIIDNILSSNNNLEKGPIGITYLPWRYEESRFATKSYTIKGNSRLIICYPSGLRHYGIHINWDMLELIDPPDNINTKMVLDVLNN